VKIAIDELRGILESVGELQQSSGGAEYAPASVKRAQEQLRALLSVVRAAELVNACAREYWINAGRNLRAIRANDRALSRLSAPPRRARAAKGART
jgi:hypothetical protein